MAKETSINTSVVNTNNLNYLSGRGACIHWTGNPGVKLSKSRVLQYSRLVNHNNAEELLSLLISDDFKQQASLNGMTLVECIVAAKDHIESIQVRPTAIETPERFAGLLSRVAPDETAQQALARLEKLVQEVGPAAVQILDKHLADHGRDQDGFILLRRSSKKGVL